MSYLRVGLKVPDQNKTNRRSLNVQRFAESLSDLKQLGIVLKAKNQFLKKIRDAGPSAPPAESLDEQVQAEWSRLAAGAVSLQVAGHDFSELEQLLGEEAISWGVMVQVSWGWWTAGHSALMMNTWYDGCI